MDYRGPPEATPALGKVIKMALVAKQIGIKDVEIDRMASAFEHADLEKAAKGS